MQYSTRLWRKKLGDCHPGELVHLSYNRTAALAIVLEARGAEDEDDTTLLAIIRAPDSPAPFHDTWPKREFCISLGTDWLIVPVISPNLVAGYMGEASGVLEVTPEGNPVIVLQPGPRPRYFGTVRADLATATEVPNTADGQRGAIGEWSIWLSAEDRMVPGAQPLHTVKVELRT